LGNLELEEEAAILSFDGSLLDRYHEEECIVTVKSSQALTNYVNETQKYVFYFTQMDFGYPCTETNLTIYDGLFSNSIYDKVIQGKFLIYLFTILFYYFNLHLLVLLTVY